MCVFYVENHFNRFKPLFLFVCLFRQSTTFDYNSLYSHENKPMLYGEIVYSDNNQRVHNMKGLARDFLKPYGINVPTDAKTMVTHNAVALLIKTLEENQR